MAQEVLSYKDAADMDASDSTQKALTSGVGLDMNLSHGGEQNGKA